MSEQFLGGRMIPELEQKPELANVIPVRRVVSNHIRETNPRAYADLLEGVVYELSPYTPPNRKIIIDIIGLEKDGKTSFLEGLMDEISQKLRQAYPSDHESMHPRIFYHDFVDSVFCHERTVSGASKLGSKSLAEYREIAEIDNDLTQLFYQLPGKAILLRKRMLTQSFRRSGEAIGKPRGDLWDTKVRRDNGNTIYTVFMDVDEAFRKKNINLWEKIRQAPKKDIAAAEKKAGIVNDTKNPDKIKAKYETSTPDTILQLTREVIAIACALNREENGFYIQEFADLDEEELLTRILDDPSVLNVLRKHMIDRIREKLSPFGSNPYDDKYIITLINSPLPKGVKRPGSIDFLQKNSLLEGLKRHVENTGDSNLSRKLKRLEVSIP